MRRARLYLPYAAWPESDRTRWEAAFKTGTDPFDDCGPAAHLAARTQLQLRYAYGKFLAFLSAKHDSLLARTPAARLDRKIIEEYVNWQPKCCGGITTANYLNHLQFALRYICPSQDWSWLLQIARRLAAQAERRPDKHHLVTSETLYALGSELMDRTTANGISARTRSVQTAFRDGLIIALLALIPLRRRTLAALRIGKHLVRSGDRWLLDIPAEDIKTKRSIEYPISAELSGRMDFYLNQIRPQIPGSGTHDYLWASSRGRPMSDGSIYNTVRRRTRKTLGFPVNLHRFRRAAAALWSTQDPTNVRGVKDLLGHASFDTTEKYYIMSQSRIAGRALARVINNVGRDLSSRGR
jgi:integrase/recombinase XerD